MEPGGCCFVRHCYKISYIEWIIGFTRFLGISTAVVLFGVGADLSYHHNHSGAFILAGACLVLFFETTWVIFLFLRVCSTYPISTWWADLLAIWTWPKTVIYSAGGCVLLLYPQELWLSSVSGGMLLLLVGSHVTIGAVGCRTKNATERRVEGEYVRCQESFEDIKVHSSSDDEEIDDYGGLRSKAILD